MSESRKGFRYYYRSRRYFCISPSLFASLFARSILSKHSYTIDALKLAYLLSRHEWRVGGDVSIYVGDIAGLFLANGRWTILYPDIKKKWLANQKKKRRLLRMTADVKENVLYRERKPTQALSDQY